MSAFTVIHECTFFYSKELKSVHKVRSNQGRFLTTIEGWAGRYPGWALGGRLDIYTVDIAILIILTIVCYLYTG